MKLLNIKIIMGLIVATSMGFLPPLCASSPTPPTENEILDAALNETFLTAQATLQPRRFHSAPPRLRAGQQRPQTAHIEPQQLTAAAAPAAQATRYRVPVRLQSTMQRLLRTLHQQGRLPLQTDIFDALIPPGVFFQYLTGYFVGAFEGRHLDRPLDGIIFFFSCCSVLRLAYMITAFTYNHAVHDRMLPALISHTQQPQILTIPRDAEILQADCSICFAPLLDAPVVPAVAQQPIIATNCNAATGNAHLFHAHCLRRWLDQYSDCPICRVPVIDPAIVEVIETEAAAASQTPAHAHTD
jgi:hypothetical protein